jgi:hypothetical protein
MSFSQSFQQLIRRILGQKPPSDVFPPPDPASSQMLQNILHMLELTGDDDCSCEQTFELIDQYAERLVNGEDAARLMPLVKRHLDLCRDCREEYEALLDVLRLKAADS